MNIIDYYNLNRKLKAHRKWLNTGGERGRGANLTQVKNLSVNKLSMVRSLCKAKLDLELIEQVKDEYPHLL